MSDQAFRLPRDAHCGRCVSMGHILLYIKDMKQTPPPLVHSKQGRPAIIRPERDPGPTVLLTSPDTGV